MTKIDLINKINAFTTALFVFGDFTTQVEMSDKCGGSITLRVETEVCTDSEGNILFPEDAVVPAAPNMFLGDDSADGLFEVTYLLDKLEG